ncbi:electron transfer flavoprotein subunit beta/FixA family protein [Schaalia naturae]|jgi:electron transfer flavoprotein beta subunit|uniref:Electron transfer flavoprotein subunit beta/FixA family protein n=1 Tax=Schaalia naturae TaxID=635203 RepID=A0ABW2SKU1_9ACTO
MARIVVCVKYVADPPEEAVVGHDLRLVRDEGKGRMGELDDYAVERALEFSSLSDDRRVCALTMGPSGAEEALRHALELGADEAVLITDPALAGSDVPATAKVLARAVTHLGDVDAVFCAMSSTDSATGLVPEMLAAELGWTPLTDAESVVEDGAEVRIRRSSATGNAEFAATGPTVVSVTDQSGEVHYPSFRDLRTARRTPIATLALDDLGLDESQVGTNASRLQVLDVQPIPARESERRILVDKDGSAAEELARYITEITRD